MADRTSNTVFYTKGLPGIIWFKANLENGDYFILPHGVAEEAMAAASDDNDVIATCVCAGSKVTIALINDEGSGVATDQDIIGHAILKTQ